MEKEEFQPQNEEYIETSLDDDTLNGIIDKLETMMEETDISLKELAEMTGIPEGTVRKFFGGNKKNPSLRNTVKVVKALGGSLDELVGIRIPNQKDDSLLVPVYKQMLEQERENTKRVLEQQRLYHEDTMAAMERSRRRTARALVVLSILFGVVVVFILVVLAIDILNRDIGWFRDALGRYGLSGGIGGAWNL